jgi:hypothetical protein
MQSNFWIYIAQSIKSPTGKVSITRISSYFILATILIGTLILFGIDVSNAIISYRKNEIYTIPNEHLWAFGMVLAHHLALLGINKTAETKEAVTGINMGTPQPNFGNMTASGEIKIGASFSSSTDSAAKEEEHIVDTPTEESTSSSQPTETPRQKTNRGGRKKPANSSEDHGETFEDPEL